MSALTRDMFPGGNTSKGFYSFYRYILSQDEARRIICIKGGPGTGKSTLMKKIGEYFNNKGYDIEYHHCSSDNNSLDGVVIKGLNIALLDGTAPHVVDPINPGAVDEILHLGDYWNEEGFKEYRRKIIDINREVGKTFRRAYRYLGAAKLIHDDWSNFYNESLNLNKLNKFEEGLKDNLFGNMPISNMGFDRHLFATAFTPNGIVTFLNNLRANYEKVYVLNGGPGMGCSHLLDFISTEALRRGYSVELFHEPLVPERIEHIFIPQLSTAILTSNEINNMKLEGIQINMKDFINNYSMKQYEREIELDMSNFYSLLNKSLSIISQAKKLHDEMETYYVPNMDFTKISEVYDLTVEKLNKYESEYLNSKHV